MPRVSVIIPAYNAARYLGETIESVVNQTYADWELIIVDDGSTDTTVAVARGYVAADPRISIVQQPNAGPAPARMTGFRRASTESEYVTFLDSDDLWETTALSTLVEALAAAPWAPGAHGLARFIDEEGRSLRPGEAEAYGRDRKAIVGDRLVRLPSDCPTGFSVLIFQCSIFTSGQLLLRRDAFQRTGGYDVSRRLVEDWPMWLRLASYGDLVFVDEVLLSYRRHPAALAGDYSRAMYVAASPVRRELAASPGLSPEQRRLARLAGRLNARYYAGLRWQWVRANLAKGDVWRAAVEARRAVAHGLRACMLRS
jgi:glycosyltransferase involved in cell wall biosynthesis